MLLDLFIMLKVFYFFFRNMLEKMLYVSFQLGSDAILLAKYFEDSSQTFFDFVNLGSVLL